MNRETRKRELHNLIDKYQKELWSIMHQERVEEDRLKLGKFYRCWCDVGRPYTHYVSVVDIDEFGNLKGTQMRVYDDESVEFSPVDKLITVNFESSEYTEITEKEFYEHWIF
jgi:hypothetical protein